MIVAVDFDGTLTTGEGPPYWQEDNKEFVDEDVAEYIRDEYKKGNSIIIWTARPWSQANNIAAHLTEWEIPYHGIRCEKGGAQIYVDDKTKPVEELHE